MSSGYDVPEENGEKYTSGRQTSKEYRVARVIVGILSVSLVAISVLTFIFTRNSLIGGFLLLCGLFLNMLLSHFKENTQVDSEDA